MPSDKNGTRPMPLPTMRLGSLSGKWKENRGPALEIRWSDVDVHVLRAAVDIITTAGGAVMFGRTSDGGAFSVCVLMGTEKLKEYPHTVDECEELLRKLAEDLV